MSCNELKENDESSNVDANNSPSPKSPSKSDEFKEAGSSLFVGYSTPKAHGVPMCYAETPENCVRNPFEGNTDEYLEKLSQTIVSPDMFSSTKHSNSETGKESPFWSIENISELNPVPIDESSIYMQSSGLKLDPEKEEAAQKATISFFEKNMNIPSPCAPLSMKRNPRHVVSSPLVAPGSTPVGTRIPLKKDDAIQSSSGHTIPRGTRLFVNTNCVLVQTDCSIPVDVDLSELLSKYMTTTSDEPTTDVSFGNDSENSANSSLRRRLFSQKEEKEDEYYDDIENEIPISSPSFATTSMSSPPILNAVSESMCFKSPPPAQTLCQTPSKYTVEFNYAESPISFVPGCKRLQDLGTPHRQTKRAMSPIEEQRDGFGHDLNGSPEELHDKPTLPCLSIITSPGFSPITKK